MIRKQSSTDQAKDTGLALVLILLICMQFWEMFYLTIPAIIVMVVTMTIPAAFCPLAKIWFGLSHFLGSIMSKILLSVVFFGVATPIGLIRKTIGADAMGLKTWKKGTGSVFVERNHIYTKKDIIKPY